METPLPDFNLRTHVSGDCDIFSVKFHPSEQILLVGDVSGSVHFALFDPESKSVTLPEGMGSKPYRPHKSGSTRSIDFARTGSDVNIVSGGSDGRVVVSNFDPAKIAGWNLGSAISVVRVLTDSLVLAGDDDGTLHAIDLRQRKKIYSISEQSDFITSIEIGNSASPLKTVIACSGDSTLAAYDLRMVADSPKRKQDRLVAMSDEQENEINCAILMNDGSHLLTGDAGGVVGIWKQGFWGDLKDRFPLYPKADGDGAHAIEAMIKIDEKKFLTATSDGIIRCCNLFPNEVETIVGVHRTSDNGEVATVSGFDCDVDMGLVASACGDGAIKFWNLNNPIKISEPAPSKTTKKKQNSNYNPEKANRQAFFHSI